MYRKGHVIERTKALFETFYSIFNKVSETGNEEALTEGFQILREIKITEIPTATTYERLDRLTQSMWKFAQKWAA